MSESPRSERWRRLLRSMVAGVFLVFAGIVVGVSVAPNWGPGPFEDAVGEPPQSTPVSLSVHAPLAAHAPAGHGQGFVQVVKAVTPAVVNIVSTRSDQGTQNPHGLSDDPFFRRFFGEEFFRRFDEPRGRQGPRERGLGSGVIVQPNGIIVTNHHVVRQATEIQVLLADRTTYPAELIGTDPKTDLAVLKIEARNLPTIPWANSDGLEVGEYVLAVGNPFGLNQTVTLGIVSAVGRARMGIAEYEDFIQTDAAINPGNSGGALVNTRGELVGISTAIFSRSGGSMGIGFAVPSNMARAILDQLVSTGEVVRGWLGVSIQELTPKLATQFGVAEHKGVLVSDIIEGSPAEQAGLRRGDIIVRFDEKSIDDATQLKNVVAATEVGKRITVTLIRDEKTVVLEIRIGEQPKAVARAQWIQPEAAAPATQLASFLSERWGRVGSIASKP